jgi:hypothetical protein
MTRPGDHRDGPHASAVAEHTQSSRGRRRCTGFSGGPDIVSPATNAQSHVGLQLVQSTTWRKAAMNWTIAGSGCAHLPVVVQTIDHPYGDKSSQDASGACTHDPDDSGVRQGCIHIGHCHKICVPKPKSVVEHGARSWHDCPEGGRTGLWPVHSASHKVDSAASRPFSVESW